MDESRAEMKDFEHQEARLQTGPGPGTQLPVCRPTVSWSYSERRSEVARAWGLSLVAREKPGREGEV